MIENAKKFWWVIPLVGYLGVGQFFKGLQPVFRFQMEAHANVAASELQGVACVQIVAGYVQARRANDTVMVEYWREQAALYGCSLPPV